MSTAGSPAAQSSQSISCSRVQRFEPPPRTARKLSQRTSPWITEFSCHDTTSSSSAAHRSSIPWMMRVSSSAAGLMPWIVSRSGSCTRIQEVGSEGGWSPFSAVSGMECSKREHPPGLARESAGEPAASVVAREVPRVGRTPRVQAPTGRRRRRRERGADTARSPLSTTDHTWSRTAASRATRAPPASPATFRTKHRSPSAVTRNTPGKGSTFRFAVRLQKGATSVRPRLLQSDLRDRKVLIIDDNPHARAVLSSMLTSLTFIADEAASGEEAINMVRQATGAGAPYEIVFIDWQMPGLNGIETGRRILSMSDSKVPPHLVMVTAYGREEVMKQAEENGFDNVLIKPVTSSVLFDTSVMVLDSDREATEVCSGRAVV